MDEKANTLQRILGSMLFGGQTPEGTAGEMMEEYRRRGGDFLDAAYVYTDGEAERIVGRFLQDRPGERWRVATKAHPKVYGRLDGEAVRAQLEESLSRLKRSSVDLFYLHFPDPVVPVDGALEECARLREEGMFRDLGVSNYPAWMVCKISRLCERIGMPGPTVYQGMYNALTRAAERELFPALRDMGIAFYAYNPLAGGILTGKYRGVRDLPSAGRFTVMPHYKDRFWHPALFQALEKLRGLCEESGTAPAAAAYRWLVHHSALRPGLGDGVIVGASTLGQLRENLDMLSGDPLPQEMQDVMEECWETARCEAPEYFRYDSPK